MYGFVTHTWNVVKGKCFHDCDYCYMKRFPQKDLWFDEKELKTDLGNGNFIFVGSSCDMFAENVPDMWIANVLLKCNKHTDNTYLFQTKNPKRFQDCQRIFPPNSIIGVTLETNRENDLVSAPSRKDRVGWFSMDYPLLKRKMVTIEPIMDFDLDVFVSEIRKINPEFVNIGADSNNKKSYKFLEPSKEKILALIEELKKFTKVNLKDNLQRLLK